MNRRTFLLLPGLVGARVAFAQAVPVVGLLSPLPAPTDAEFTKFATITRLRGLGWIDGKNVRVERAFAGHEGRLPEFAAKLVQQRVDVIWALGPEAALAAARVTTTIPIVFWGVGYPVEQGLVQSLARPGRNATGVTALEGIGIYQKQLELLQDILPRARRVAWIRAPSAIRTITGEDSGTHAPIMAAAKTFGVELHDLPVHRDDDFDKVFEEIRRSHFHAMWVLGTMLTVRNRSRILAFAEQQRLPSMYFVQPDNMMTLERARIVRLANKGKLPVMYWRKEFVEAGGLIAYGADNPAQYRRAATYVDKGAKPGDLAVEQVSNYELIVNLKAAKAIGLRFPQGIRMRADRVIE